VLRAGRRYDELRSEQRRRLELRPDDVSRGYQLARSSFLASGATREVEEFFSQLGDESAGSGAVRGLRADWALITGNDSEHERLVQQVDSTEKRAAAIGRTRRFERALFSAARGDLTAARAELSGIAALRSACEAEPAVPGNWTELARWEALLGSKETALACAHKAMELVPEARNAEQGRIYSVTLPFVHSWTGETDRAIAEYARLLRVPFSGLNVHEMKRHPAYAPLRGDPRFEALLNDPRNNAPLF
jgi:tetratricopeptide (TPR) repeat protein